MKAYLRIDPLMDERKSHYTPAQYGTFTKVLGVASRQTHPGRFRSMAALIGTMPAAYARHVRFLLSEGDLVQQPDGTVYVDGWDEWQEGDITVAERMARMRNRLRNRQRNGSVTGPSPAAIGVDVSVDVDSSKGSTSAMRSSQRAPVLAATDALKGTVR